MTGAVRVEGLRVGGEALAVAVAPGTGVRVRAPTSLDVRVAGERGTAAGPATP